MQYKEGMRGNDQKQTKYFGNACDVAQANTSFFSLLCIALLLLTRAKLVPYELRPLGSTPWRPLESRFPASSARPIRTRQSRPGSTLGPPFDWKKV